MRLGAHTRRKMQLRREVLQEFGKGCTRLLNIESRLREVFCALRQHHGRRLAGLRRLDVRLHGKGQVMLARSLDVVEAMNDDIACPLGTRDAAADIVSNFLQGLLHAAPRPYCSFSMTASVTSVAPMIAVLFFSSLSMTASSFFCLAISASTASIFCLIWIV